MFEKFLAMYEVDHFGGGDRYAEADLLVGTAGYVELMSTYAGASFGQGIYRLHNAESARAGQELASGAFPDSSESLVFSVDWSGNQYAVNPSGTIAIFEIFSGEALDTKTGFVEFHESLMTDLVDDLLTRDLFNEWMAGHPESTGLERNECLGYIHPPTLGGGEFDVDNLEITDLEVYWHFMSQMFTQLDDVPEGSRIDSVVNTWRRLKPW